MASHGGAGCLVANYFVVHLKLSQNGNRFVSGASISRCPMKPIKKTPSKWSIAWSRRPIGDRLEGTGGRLVPLSTSPPISLRSPSLAAHISIVLTGLSLAEKIHPALGAWARRVKSKATPSSAHKLTQSLLANCRSMLSARPSSRLAAKVPAVGPPILGFLWRTCSAFRPDIPRQSTMDQSSTCAPITKNFPRRLRHCFHHSADDILNICGPPDALPASKKGTNSSTTK